MIIRTIERAFRMNFQVTNDYANFVAYQMQISNLVSIFVFVYFCMECGILFLSLFYHLFQNVQRHKSMMKSYQMNFSIALNIKYF